MDDDLSFSELLRDISLSVCSDIEIFTDPFLLIDTLFSSSDIIILDIKMPKMDGVEILRRLAIKKCKAKIILISGFDSCVLHSSSMLANELGLNVVAQVTKPVQPKQIQNVIFWTILGAKMAVAAVCIKLEGHIVPPFCSYFLTKKYGLRVDLYFMES